MLLAIIQGNKVSTSRSVTMLPFVKIDNLNDTNIFRLLLVMVLFGKMPGSQITVSEFKNNLTV